MHDLGVRQLILRCEVCLGAMRHFAKSPLIRLLLVTTAIAVLVIFAVPAYTRAVSPKLTDERGVAVHSNTRFPAVSMRVFLSGANRDRARILFLHRRTKATDGHWFPDWFEPEQTDAGTPVRHSPVTCVLNGRRLYPRDDSNVLVVYASDEDAPATISVPYSQYAALTWNDTGNLWKALVEDIP